MGICLSVDLCFSSQALNPGLCFWCRQELDSAYHFSCQFTADLIAMNTADFIIT